MTETTARSCAVCGRSIDHMRGDAHTCGARCRREASRRRHGILIERAATSCAHCGSEITGRRRDAVYCGPRCKRLAARERLGARIAAASSAEPQRHDLAATRAANLKRAQGAAR